MEMSAVIIEDNREVQQNNEHRTTLIPLWIKHTKEIELVCYREFFLWVIEYRGPCVHQ